MGTEYIKEMLIKYKPRSLSSADVGQLVDLRVQTKHHEAAFSCYAANRREVRPKFKCFETAG